MSTATPSRRQLLGGLFASLLGWLFLPRKKAPAAPLPPAPAPAASAGRMTTVTTYVYDANKERVGAPITRHVPEPATVCTCELDGDVTTYTFREVTP